MTKADIRDSIIGRIGADWIAKNQIENAVIDDMIVDEYEKLIGDTMLLEGEFTGTTDGVNPYMEINESIMLVKRVHYDYTAGSDWGTLLTEITPLEAYDDIESGDPENYWIQGMHRYNRQRLYFDKLPEAGVTVRALFYIWPDAITSDTEILEIKRLWAKAIKHIIAAHVCLMGRDVKEVIAKQALHNFEMAQYQDTMRVVNSVPKRPLVGSQVVYRDI